MFTYLVMANDLDNMCLLWHHLTPLNHTENKRYLYFWAISVIF